MNSHSKFPHAMEVDLITQQTLYAKYTDIICPQEFTNNT